MLTTFNSLLYSIQPYSYNDIGYIINKDNYTTLMYLFILIGV